jgi:hypothetical protein
MARLTRHGVVLEARRTLSEVDAAEASLSRSGTATTPRAARAARGRPLVTLSLSTEALARLDALAAERGQTRSGAVEQLVRNARMRER